jgi:hypothetical protein
MKCSLVFFLDVHRIATISNGITLFSTVAAQHGATPETPIHNNKTSSVSHHIGTSKVDAEGHNIRKGDGTQANAVPGLVRDKAEEAEKDSAQSAYNEETGEINWDCPVGVQRVVEGFVCSRSLTHQYVSPPCSVLVEWPKDLVEKTSRPLSVVSYTLKRNPRDSIVSTSSRPCRIVSGNIPTFTGMVSDWSAVHGVRSQWLLTRPPLR